MKPCWFIWIRGWHPFTSSRIHMKYSWPCMRNMTLMELRVLNVMVSSFEQLFRTFLHFSFCGCCCTTHNLCNSTDNPSVFIFAWSYLLHPSKILEIKWDPDFNEESSYQIIPLQPPQPTTHTHKHSPSHPSANVTSLLHSFQWQLMLTATS